MVKETKQLENIELYIRVPGTSANLGPGFDILGLALKIYNEFYFKFGDNLNYQMSLMDGSPLPFPAKNNLLLEAYKTYFQTFLPGQKQFKYSVKMNLDLPLKGGLGSSASALVAGFAAASYIHKNIYQYIPMPSESEFLYTLAELEGHPDNTTPAFLGGFIFSYFYENKLIYFKKHIPESTTMFLFIPALETETNDSRKKLPEKYCTDDIVFNMARMGTWMQYLQSGNYEDLKLAIQDRIHTPYRINQLPFLEKVGHIIQELGYCYTLSGSGPTLLIYCKSEKKDSFISEFKAKLEKENNHPIHYRILEIDACTQGTLVKEFRLDKISPS